MGYREPQGRHNSMGWDVGIGESVRGQYGVGRARDLDRGDRGWEAVQLSVGHPSTRGANCERGR